MKPDIGRNVRLLSWLNFFTDLRFYSPVAIIYFSDVSCSYALGMSIFSIVFVSQALFEMPTGLVSDMIGRKKTMIAGAFTGAFGMFFYAMASVEQMTDFGYWFLVTGAFFEGFSRSFYSGTDNALLYESLKQQNKENRFHEMLGKTASMFQFALSISALIGAFIANISFAMVMWLSVVPQVICFFISLFFIEPDVKKQEEDNIFTQIKTALKTFTENRQLLLLSIIDVVDNSFGEASHQFEAAFFKLVVPVWVIGIARTIAHVLAAISFWFAGKVIDRVGHLKVLVSGTLVSGVLHIIALLYASFLSPFLMAASSIFFGLKCTAKGSLFQEGFSDSQRASMGSVVAFFGSMGFGIVSVLMGYVADITSPSTALLAALFIRVSLVFLYKGATKKA